jgi:hypothetical protein
MGSKWLDAFDAYCVGQITADTDQQIMPRRLESSEAGTTLSGIRIR